MANKTRAKEILYAMSSPDERAQMAFAELKRVDGLVESLSDSIGKGASKEEIEGLSNSVIASLSKLKEEQFKFSRASAESMKEMKEDFLKGLKSLQDVLSEHSKSQDFNKNAGPLYKTMINSISGVERAVKDKPVPHWSWPQYAAVSVRNKNFANINPSISPFGIEDYDEVDITYSGSNPTVVVYKLNGLTMGTLTISYSGSNVVKVIRT